MTNATTSHTYYLSSPTDKEFKKFIETLTSENDYEKAAGALLRDVNGLLVDKTGGLIGDAIHRGLLTPETGAQLTFPDFQYYFRDQGKGKLSIADQRWGLPYKDDLATYRLVGTLIAWQFTQTIVLSLPSFNPYKDVKGSAVESIPVGLFYLLYGLPMYVPVQSEKYWGVMVNQNPSLTAEEVLEYYGPEVLEDKPKGSVKQFFSVQYLLFSKKADDVNINVVSLWHNASRVYRNKTIQELDRDQGEMPLSFIQERLASHGADWTEVQPCIDALVSILYLTQNLPYPNWIQEKKDLSIEKDPKTNSLLAVPPEKPNAVLLTPDCCIDLSGPPGSISVEEREEEQSKQ